MAKGRLQPSARWNPRVHISPCESGKSSSSCWRRSELRPRRKADQDDPQNFRLWRASTLFCANKFFVRPRLLLGPNRVGHIAAVIRTSGLMPRPCLHLKLRLAFSGDRNLLPWRNRSRFSRDSLRCDVIAKNFSLIALTIKTPCYVSIRFSYSTAGRLLSCLTSNLPMIQAIANMTTVPANPAAAVASPSELMPGTW